MARPESQEARIIAWPKRAPTPSERQFLPAALEIMETPASPAGRGIVGVIIGFFCVALAWSWFGRVDIIATAQGRITPTGQTKLVQPLEAGIVRDILVRDGDYVLAGSPVIRLDDVTARADRNRVARDFLDSELDVARLTTLVHEIDPARVPGEIVAPAGTALPELATARALALAQAAEQAQKLAMLDRQIEKTRAETDENDTSIAKLQATLPMVQAKADLWARLLKIEFANRLEYFNSQQALIEARHDLAAQRQKTKEIEAERAGLERQKEQTRSEYAHKLFSDLADAEQKVAEHTQDLAKAERKLSEAELRAPVDGFVQQLAIHTLGGVVTPAQPLLIVVPKDSKLVVEADVSNDDVGFVQVGQEAEVKVATYNFTRYGLVRARVVYVSQDAVSQSDKRQADKNSDDALDDKSGEDHDKGAPTYVVRLELAAQSMTIDGHLQALRPGMAVTAEIKTGSRRILSYLLSPLKKYAQEAIRER